MLHTLLRRRANGERIEDIRTDLLIPTAKNKGPNPSPASVCRSLAGHEKQQAYPEAAGQAHAEFSALGTSR